jgi:hypothetical protein
VAARGHLEDTIALVVREGHRVVRKQARQIGEQAAGNDHCAVSGNLSRNRGAKRDLHVGGREREVALLSAQENPVQHLDRATRREPPRDDSERGSEIVPRTGRAELGGGG